MRGMAAGHGLSLSRHTLRPCAARHTLRRSLCETSGCHARLPCSHRPDPPAVQPVSPPTAAALAAQHRQTGS